MSDKEYKYRVHGTFEVGGWNSHEEASKNYGTGTSDTGSNQIKASIGFSIGFDHPAEVSDFVTGGDMQMLSKVSDSLMMLARGRVSLLLEETDISGGKKVLIKVKE